MKNKEKLIFFMLLVSLVASTKALHSQTVDRFREVRIACGALLDADLQDKDFISSAYLAPALRINRHEIFIGALITERLTASSPLVVGGVAGYKFYLFREPARVNMSVNYSLRYFQYSGTTYEYRDWMYEIVEEKWKTDNFVNTFGFGFNANLDKKRRFELFSDLGYTITAYLSDQRIRTQMLWSKINLTLGLNVKLFSFNKKG